MARMAASERREKLLDAAIRVMTRDGLAAATVRAIVAEAGMHVAAFHYCFDSKEDLLREVLADRREHNRQTTILALEPGADAATALRRGFESYWDDVEADVGGHRLTYELTQHVLRVPELEHLATLQYEQYHETAEEFLTTIQVSAGIRWAIPVPVLTRMVVTILDGLTLNWLIDRNSEAARAALAQFASSLSMLAEPAG